jgi:hypothetical protein
MRVPNKDLALEEAAVAAAKVIPAEFESGGHGLDYWRAVAEAVLASVDHQNGLELPRRTARRTPNGMDR